MVDDHSIPFGIIQSVDSCSLIDRDRSYQGDLDKEDVIIEQPPLTMNIMISVDSKHDIDHCQDLDHTFLLNDDETNQEKIETSSLPNDQENESLDVIALACDPVISKSQKKRILRMALRKEHWRLMRPIEKARKKAKRAENRGTKIGKLMINDDPSLSSQILMDQDPNTLSLPRSSLKRRCRESICFSPQRIIIDLDFESRMTQRDLTSLATQLSYCYAINCSLENPVQLIWTSFGSKIKDHFSTMEGFEQWTKKTLELKSESYEALYSENELVYLTADSNNILEKLDYEKIYIIGGIVDHNKYKNLCYNKAMKGKIETARLPIDEYVHFQGRKVLTVNQVFEMMAYVVSKQNWQEAIEKVSPKRKNVKGPKQGEIDQKDQKKLETES